MGTTANSFFMQSIFFFLALNSERHLLSFACSVSPLSDQAMLTFVQINLIKFKKKMLFIYLEHVLCITSLKPGRSFMKIPRREVTHCSGSGSSCPEPATVRGSRAHSDPPQGRGFTSS